MPIQMTIIGLGQIGTSIGLALAERKELLRRVGHDRELKIAQQAEKMGAIDHVEINLPRAVRGADLVLLTLPTDQLRETMAIVGMNIKEGCVVMDTSSIKEVVAKWAKELLPEGRPYIGLTPVINPHYLHGSDMGIEAARADLFQSGLMAIVTSPYTDADAIKLAVDLTRLLGAKPLFIDPVEIDGLTAATHLLPQLLSASLLNATVDQPGWYEARRVAGRAYAEVSGPIVQLGEASALRAALMYNRENVLRVLDNAIAALNAIREDIAVQDESGLEEQLQRAHRGRAEWWKGRLAGEWADAGIATIEMPETPGLLTRLFGIGRKSKPKS